LIDDVHVVAELFQLAADAGDQDQLALGVDLVLIQRLR
jgi:hypothetical protein